MKKELDKDLEILNEEELDQVEEETVRKPETAVEKVEAEVVATGTVIANMLNIRSGPGTNFVPIGTLTSGAVVEYTVENDEWLKLTNGGYVMKKFIQ